MTKSFYLPYAILCALLLSACGGDGGGGGGNESLTYTGNNAASSISASNAGVWAVMAMGGAQSLGSFNPLSAGTASIPDLERTLARHAASLSTTGKTVSSGDSNTNQMTIQQAVNESQACDNNGTVQVKGNVEENGNQQLTLIYDTCELAGVLADGVVKVNMTNVTLGGSFNATFDYEAFTISGEDFSLIQDGEVALSMRTINGPDQTLVLNLVIEDEINGSMLRFLNFSSRSWYEEFDPAEPGTGPSGRFTVSGRIYDSVLGYVDLATTQVFLTSDTTVMPPDYSGILRISGSNGSQALVEARHDNTLSFFIIKVDADNNGVYEINAVIPYEFLDSDLATDLADTDGDGMHNSWETFYTLNPADPADATGDADSDGADNLLEYSSGYDPRDAGSTPPP